MEVFDTISKEASVSEVSIIGLDIAKNVFQVHGADASGRELLRKRVSRAKLGHDFRLIAPAYVKPFVNRQNNDAADAEAICEAAKRPSMRFVPVKTEAQQAAALVF